jgi:MFS family permease
VVLASLAVMALGTGLLPLASGPAQVIVLYGVVAAIGHTGAGLLPVSVHVARWFPGERGLAMAVAACGFPVGHLAFTQLAAHATAAMGWRRTYALLAAVVLAGLGAFALCFRDAPGRPGRRAPATPGAAEPGTVASLDRRAALRTPAFWWLTAGLITCGFTDFLMTTHLPTLVGDLGLTPAVAANAVSLWAAANVVGILAAGGLAARAGARRALVLTFLVRAASFGVLLAAREPWQLYLFALLFGATFFTTAPLTATLVGQLFGPAHQGLIFGAVNLFHHTAGALGAYAGGLTFDRTGSYQPILLASGLLVAGAAACSARIRPPRRPSGGADAPGPAA